VTGFSSTYKLLIIYLFLQEQENSNTDATAMAETTISTPINKTETVLFKNETETNLTKIESEIIIVNNTGNERSDAETLIESMLNQTETRAEEIPLLVTQDCNKTKWNQSGMQIRQQQSVANTQETQKYKNNISSTQEVNTADHQRNSLHRDGKTISEDTEEEMESEHLQNTSVLADSYQNIHKMSSSDIDQDDKVPETNYLSHTLSPLIERNDGTVPIRVILHYPHEHRHENEIVSEHEYIVLQTGNPAYHGHLEKTAILGQETPDKDGKGLNTAEADRQTSSRRYNGRKNHGRVKASTSGEIRNTTESHEEKSAGKVYHHHHKGWKKHNSQEATDSHEGETSTEISQDIRKHGNHQNSIKPTHNNTIHVHKGKGRRLHKPGHSHKKHKFIQITVADDTNETVSKELTTKDKQHNQPHVTAAEGRNETSEVVIIKSNNRKNSSTDIIRKDEVHRKRPAGKKTRYQHHRTSVTEKLNGTRNGSTSTLNVSSAQQPSIPLSTVWHKAHIPIGEHNEDDDLKETDDSHEEQRAESKPKQGDNSKAENLRMSSISSNNGTDISADEVNGSKKNTQCSGVQNEESVEVNDLRKPNAEHVTDEPTASSREDSSDSEIQGENIIKHYSKLLKWIDYPL
jgi:hypothetical protein